MKYILCQPSGTRFEWELDVFLTNLRALDKTTPVVLLFMAGVPKIIDHFKGRYPNLEIHVYEDTREVKGYLATVKPYLIWRYLSADPAREKETYFQVDSDIIFRELPDFSKLPMDGKTAWTSDCHGYIDYEYLITREDGPYIVEKFSEMVGIPVEKIRITPGGGAQWLMSNTTADLWWHIWQDSQTLYDFLAPLRSNIQKWTAEMWAQLYNLVKFGWDVQISDELSFIRPTEPFDDYYKVKILHNAGVTAQLSDTMFFKGDYIYLSPFRRDLTWVSNQNASWHYARAIEKAYNHIV